MIVAARFPAPCVGTLAVIAVTRRGRYATTPEKRVEELNPSCAAGRFFSQRPVKTIYRSIDEYTTASANLAAKAQRQAGNGVSPILRPVPLPEGGTDMRAADCTRPLEREGLMRRKRAGGGRSARRFDEGMWRRSYGEGTRAPPDERGGNGQPNLRPPRHISTLPISIVPSTRPSQTQAG